MTAAARAVPIALASAVLAASIVAGAAAAAAPRLQIEPPAAAVAKGADFSLLIVQHADQATSGTQASLTFDPAVVQVTSVERGAPFKDASVYLPADMTKAIAAANAGGKLSEVAVAFLPPAHVPPGDADVLVVGFRAVGCGTVQLGLPVGSADAIMLDGGDATYGQPLQVTTTGATVTVGCGDGPGTGDQGAAPAVSSQSGPPTAGLALAALSVVALLALAGWQLVRRGRRPA